MFYLTREFRRRGLHPGEIEHEYGRFFTNFTSTPTQSHRDINQELVGGSRALEDEPFSLQHVQIDGNGDEAPLLQSNTEVLLDLRRVRLQFLHPLIVVSGPKLFG